MLGFTRAAVRLPVLHRLAVVTAVATSLALASAQDASFGAFVGARSAGGLVAVTGVPSGGGTFDVGAVVSEDPGLHLGVRWSDAFGALGTVVIEGDAEVRVAGTPAARASVTARGVLGPVAARIGAGIDGAAPERFVSGAASGHAPYARGAWGRIGLDGRIDRTWLLSGSATAWRADAGAWTIDLLAGARARSLLRRDLDARAVVTARAGSEPSAGIALGAIWAPRRAPEVEGRVWFDVVRDAGGWAVAPGAELRGAWRIGGDRIDVAALARPGGPARSPWSLDVLWRRPLASDGEAVTVRVGAQHGGVAASDASIEVTYVRPLELVSRSEPTP